MIYSDENLKKLEDSFSDLNEEYKSFLLIYNSRIKLSKKESNKYYFQGFLRRLKTIKKCLDNVYMIYPPRASGQLDDSSIENLEINLQSFILNVFGCIDNLAWIWVYENDIKFNGKIISPGNVGIFGRNKNDNSYKYKDVRRSFSNDLNTFIDTFDTWYKYLEDYRHSLAHRIPLYVPKAISDDDLNKISEYDLNMIMALQNRNIVEYEKLSNERNVLNSRQKVNPIMLCYVGDEIPPVCFHAQMISDFRTIIEISKKILDNFL